MENKFFVSMKGDGSLIIMRPVPRELSKEDARNLAAWLMVMSTPDPADREEAILSVEST